jgi:hypothetical protein
MRVCARCLTFPPITPLGAGVSPPEPRAKHPLFHQPSNTAGQPTPGFSGRPTMIREKD